MTCMAIWLPTGVLVQLMLDGQADKARELRAFLVSLGTPVTLAEMNVPLDKAGAARRAR